MGFLFDTPEQSPFHWLHGDGRPIASVRYTPDELHQLNGIVFSRTYDGLDNLSFAAYSPADRPIPGWSVIPALLVLIRYDGDPDPGTTVYADAALSIEQAYELTQHLLGIQSHDFTWLAEHEVSDLARVGD